MYLKLTANLIRKMNPALPNGQKITCTERQGWFARMGRAVGLWRFLDVVQNDGRIASDVGRGLRVDFDGGQAIGSGRRLPVRFTVQPISFHVSFAFDDDLATFRDQVVWRQKFARCLRHVHSHRLRRRLHPRSFSPEDKFYFRKWTQRPRRWRYLCWRNHRKGSSEAFSGPRCRPQL